MPALDERGRALAARFTDRYTFEGLLGHGGFAAVYRVRNLRLDRVEALKVLLEDRGGDPKFAARFEREARVAASLEHPNVIRIYDFGNADGTLWYSIQYVDGPTLRARLERHGRMRGEERQQAQDWDFVESRYDHPEFQKAFRELGDDDFARYLDRVVDDGEFFEIHEHFAKNIICGFARIDGFSVGVVGNQPAHMAGVLDIDDAPLPGATERLDRDQHR